MFILSLRGPTTLSLAVTVLLGAFTANAAAYTMMGDVLSHEQNDHNVTFRCENGSVRLSFLDEGIIRVHMAPDGRFPADTLHENENGPYMVVRYSWPGVPYGISEGFDYDLEGTVYNIRAGEFSVKVRKQPFKLAFYDKNGRRLVMEKEGVVNAGLGHEASKVYETMHLPDDEHFFGFGAYNNPIDMRGRKMTCYATEMERKPPCGGFPVPFFYSTNGYGIFFNNLDDDATLEMGTTLGEYRFWATSGGMEGWDMDYYIMLGPKFEDVLKRYIKIVGPPMLPEKWFFGHIQCKCCDWAQKDIVNVARRYRAGDWPCDVIIIDMQGMKKDFQWTELYPDPAAMYAELDKTGFKTGLSTALFVDLFDWKRYDPTVPAICAEYWSLHLPRLKDGNAFWWQDNSERFTKYSAMQAFANGYESHELFGSLWAKNVVEGMESEGFHGRPVISRGGPIGGHRYIIPFAGDVPHGLEYITDDLNWLRNGSLSLYPFLLVELGGFKGENPLSEQNVIRRMINLVPVVPICRAHGTGDQGAMLPWQLTERQQDLYRYYLKFRYRLVPYIYSAAIEAAETGRPILAPIAFDYTEDTVTYDKGYTFLIGRQLLAAPVLEKADSRSVYLPEGNWFHYWTGRKYKGGRTVTVAAPLYGRDGLPLFVKAGAVIPMMPEMSYIYENKPEPVTLDVWPAEGTSSRWEVLDRETVKSATRKTVLVCAEDEEAIEITIDPAEISYELVVHLDSETAEVTAGGRKLQKLAGKADFDSAAEGWFLGSGLFYGNPELVTLNIKLPAGGGGHTVRIAKQAAGEKTLPGPSAGFIRPESITATASSINCYLEPRYSCDGSGLTEDRHTNLISKTGPHCPLKPEGTMWLGGWVTDKTWILYEFDRPYSLGVMKVWNFNQITPGADPKDLTGRGIRRCRIEHSIDGGQWQELGEFELARADATSSYTHNSEIDFGGTTAKMVKITVLDTYGEDLAGLSEVRFGLSEEPAATESPSPPARVAMCGKPGESPAVTKVRLTEESPLFKMVLDYADCLLENGRDTYGKHHCPLVAAALDRRTLSLMHSFVQIEGQRPGDRVLTGANPQHDQNLYQILYALSEVTGDEYYAQEADRILKWFFENCQSPATGLMAWGEHMGWCFYRESVIFRRGDNHEFFGPWTLWDRSFDLAPLACERFARGLWNHQIADYSGDFSRHAGYIRHRTDKGANFPRHGGFYIATWANAYARTPDEVFLIAIETVLDYFESTRNPKTGIIPCCSCQPSVAWPPSNLSLAIDLWDSAKLVPPELAEKMRRSTAKIDEIFLKIPHDVSPAGAGLVHSLDADMLDVGGLKRHEKARHRTTPWSMAYGVVPEAPLAMAIYQRYRQTKDDRLRNLVLGSAERYIGTMPPKGGDLSLYPGAVASTVSLMTAAYTITGEGRYLDEAQRLADAAIEIFFDESCPLPKASSNNDHYEAITGGDSLMSAIFTVWAVENCPRAADLLARNFSR